MTCKMKVSKSKQDGKSSKKRKVRYVHDEDEEDKYEFVVKSVSQPETVEVTVG